jgi:hypothetical protein
MELKNNKGKRKMKFKCEPKLFLTVDEYETLSKATKLCRDMDYATSFDYNEETNESIAGCELCPFKNNCSKLANDCIYSVASDCLGKILEFAEIV